MSYTIDLGQWNSIFAVPASVVDNHIKLATEAQLKVLLYILRNSGTELDDDRISSALHIDPAEVKNAVDFWTERGLIALGFFKDEADIANSPVQQFGQVKVGDIKYKDVNEDGVINENDYVTQDYGNTFPSLNYAFTLGAEYKGFGINATFQGAAHQVKNLRYVDGVWGALSDNRNLSLEYYDNCFDVAGANALYPRLSTENVANNAQNSTIWYRNVSWLKLRDCEVYYKLPASVIEPLKLASAKVFVQGQNLLTFDNIDAMDAENLNTGYPVMKSVNIGLNVTF